MRTLNEHPEPTRAEGQCQTQTHLLGGTSEESHGDHALFGQAIFSGCESGVGKNHCPVFHDLQTRVSRLRDGLCNSYPVATSRNRLDPLPPCRGSSRVLSDGPVLQ